LHSFSIFSYCNAAEGLEETDAVGAKSSRSPAGETTAVPCRVPSQSAEYVILILLTHISA